MVAVGSGGGGGMTTGCEGTEVHTPRGYGSLSPTTYIYNTTPHQRITHFFSFFSKSKTVSGDGAALKAHSCSSSSTSSRRYLTKWLSVDQEIALSCYGGLARGLIRQD